MPPEPQQLLLLTPSVGLGGGIERYVAAVVEGLENRAVRVTQEALFTTGQRSGKAWFVLRALRSSWALRRSGRTIRVVAAHPSLLSVALLCCVISRSSECQVVFYGIDIWGASKYTRLLTRHVPGVRPVCISSFGAGAVSALRVAAILRPGITRCWFDTLVAAGDRNQARRIPVLTVLRLEDWQTKGVPELLQASSCLSHCIDLGTGPRLVIAGQGPVPAALEHAVRAAAHVELVVTPTDAELAALYGDSMVLALATRTRSQGELTGEGFGMVLAEAQIAGCPVVAPTAGGSDDAYVDGLTGVRPMDEGVASLRERLEFVLADKDRWQELSDAASVWARRSFDPDRFADSARAAFLPNSRSQGTLSDSCAPCPGHRPATPGRLPSEPA